MLHLTPAMESLGISEAGSTISQLMEQIRRAEDYKSVSLTQFTKRTSINSRAFVDDAVVDDPIMSPLMLMLHQMYIGFIMTALEVSQMVDGSRTIRDVLNTVATENQKMWRDALQIANESFGFLSTPNLTGTSGSTVDLNHGADFKLPIAKMVEMTLQFGDKKVTTNMFVQISPSIVPSDVMSQFVAMNFSPSIKQRYLQYSAGEIKFWRDFVAERDLLAKRRKALKTDKDGILHEMEARKSNALSNSLLKYLLVSPDRQNIANTILIFDSKTFNKACSDANMNFNMPKDRDRFFASTFSMFVVVVDTMYSRVSIWFNGISHKADYTFNLIRSNTKNGDKFELKDIMSAFSQGVVPKF